jgi:hypothetical protein
MFEAIFHLNRRRFRLTLPSFVRTVSGRRGRVQP